MKTTLILFLSFSLGQFAYAQDTLTDSHTLNESFITWEIGLASTYIDSRNIEFGQYTLKKGKYYPTYNFGFFYTKTNLFNEQHFLLKSGIMFNSNYTDLTDSLDNELRFSETNLTIPILIGMRLPVQYNAPGDKFYKVVHLNVGCYVSFPFGPALYESGDTWVRSDEFFSDYIKFGLMTEIEFTALNKEGKGHRFGLRTMMDFQDVIKFDDKYGIRPVYASVGVFYNIITY